MKKSSNLRFILKKLDVIRMKWLVVLIVFCSISSCALAQTYSIGHTSVVFFDNLRNRNIATEIYYPADSPGEDVSVSTGNFPVLVFAHGFLIDWNSYENYWAEVVPNGYVICFPTTEMGISPNHQDFGDDLRFLATQMQFEAQDINSLFWNSLAQETGLLGHSMGGGATFLGAENNSDIDALVNFAAAETNPSAISSASNISIPALIFSGDDDCVAPPIDHQDLMYEALNSACKTQINIVNGGHCYFAEDNPTCNFGESFCGGTLNITRAEQQAVTSDFLRLWLDYALKDDQEAFVVFNDSLQSSNRISFSQICNLTSIENESFEMDPMFYPNPVASILEVTLTMEASGGTLFIYNLMGESVYWQPHVNTNCQINVTNLPPGPYSLFYTKGVHTYSSILIKN